VTGHSRWVTSRETAECESIARVVWEANRTLQIADGEEWPDVPWDSASDERRGLCLDVVKMVCARVVQDPATAHEMWATGMALDGWVWDHEKDLERKTHPSLVPWNQLTPRGQLGQRFLVFIATEMTRAEGAEGAEGAESG
jgi:hypothetical protein